MCPHIYSVRHGLGKIKMYEKCLLPYAYVTPTKGYLNDVVPQGVQKLFHRVNFSKLILIQFSHSSKDMSYF